MKKVLYIVDDEKSAQFRYRVHNLVEATKVSQRWQVGWTHKAKLEEKELEGVDLVVILRQTDKDGTMGKTIDLARGKGIKVLFDLDDLVFDYADLPLLMRSTNSKNVFYWAGYFWGIRRIAKKVDGFICTNEFLAGKLKRSFGKPVGVIPNSLDQEQVEASEKWVKKLGKLEKAKEAVRGAGKFTIGYFSGSPTHTKDFRLVEPELVRFLQAHDDAELKVVGDMEYSAIMQDLIAKGRVETAGKTDYLRLQGRIAKVDVNIAPLVVNDFTNCKSELKFFEAAAVETTTIASPTYAFKKAIKDGENGYLARPGEWYDKLEYLYQHPEENRKMALAAKKYALKHYYGKEFLKEVEAAYDYFVKDAKK